MITKMKKLILLTTILIGTSLWSFAQIEPTKEMMEFYTPEWRGEREDGGRPIVPDELLDRLLNLSIEEAWGVLRGEGYHNQFEGGWETINNKPFVGRALTVQYSPARPEIKKQIEELERARLSVEGANLNELKRQLRNLENEQMTQPMSPQKEKKLIEVISELHNKIKGQEERLNKDPRLKKAVEEEKILKQKAEKQHDLVEKLAKRAQDEHENMIGLIKQLDNLIKKVTKKIITKDSFEKDFGIETWQWISIKCLSGDKGDNILGIKGVGEVKNPKNAKGSMAIKYIEGVLNKGVVFDRIKSKEGQEIVARNVQLIRLPFNGKKKINVELNEDEFDKEQFISVFVDYGFQSFIKKEMLDKWSLFYG